jgi:hypothetical protein
MKPRRFFYQATYEILGNTPPGGDGSSVPGEKLILEGFPRGFIRFVLMRPFLFLVELGEVGEILSRANTGRCSLRKTISLTMVTFFWHCPYCDS